MINSRKNKKSDKEAAAGSSVVSTPVDANQHVASSLQRYAEQLVSSDMPESAISVLCTALMLKPARVALIHKIGQCLEKIGSLEDAKSCFHGSLPDSVNERYFNSADLSDFIKPALACVDVEYITAFTAESIDLQAPKRNPTEKRYGQFNYKATNARDTFCTVAPHGSVWFDGFNLLALDRDGNVIQEQMKGNEFACMHTVKATQPRRLDGTVCFLDGRSSKIYYHWILDILPKLGVVEKAGISLDDIDYYVVAARSDFQLNTLRACGVRDEQLIFDETTSLYQADKVIVPCLRNDLGERIYHGLGIGLGSWIPRFLQQKLGPVAGEETSGTGNSVRVYISRSARGSRNIANEPAMISALQKRGFQTVEFEKLTVLQQAELMSSADVVVGVHGAGFTNLSFCKPGTRVIEIFGDYVVPCYWSLCAVADLQYAQYMARSIDTYAATDNPGERVGQLRDMEIEINADEFIDYLDTVLDAGGRDVAAL